MRVVFITGTRADFGKLKPVILALQELIDVRVFVTGMHMLSRYGSTYREVLKAGVSQPYLFSNQRAGDPMDYVLARTLQGLGDYLKENQADVVVVHGDRVEAMAGALAGALHNVLVVHIEGGEVSGTVDEHLRHAVTKLSHLHLVANREARRRVIQLGEHPDAVHVTGSPDLDVMSSPELPGLPEVRGRYGIDFPEYGICIFHPVTTEAEAGGRQAQELLAAMEESGRSWVVIYPNNDHGAEAILEAYEPYKDHQRFAFFPSLRFEYFLSLLKHCHLMVGNSSAGVREAPFFGRPVLDVGSRQQNRYSNPSVVRCEARRESLLSLIRERWGRWAEPSSDFGDGRSTERIVRIFLGMERRTERIQKVFRDIAVDNRERREAMEGLEKELREVQLGLLSMQLDGQYRRNLEVFEMVLPEAFEILDGHEPRILGLHYDDSGFVNLADLRSGKPLYNGDPAEDSRIQVERYRERPRHLWANNKPANTLDEENNAHLLNSNRVTELLTENPQERIEPLPDRVDFLLLLGLGLGHPLVELLEGADIRNLCVVEPEVDVFQASAHLIDWAPILERFSRPGYSMELIVGKDADGCLQDLRDFLADIGGFQAVVPFVFEHLNSPTLSAVLEGFRSKVLQQEVSGAGYFDDEQVGLAHSLANYRSRLPILSDHSRDTGLTVGMPAFLVANGPSLDQAVGFLRENRGQGVVVSCGTALGSLVKIGIKPDFHVEMERSRPVVEWISEATDEEDRKGITLLALSTVHPEVCNLFPRVGLAMKPNDTGARFLTRFREQDGRFVSLVNCNPTVGNAALSFVAALGFREVYLFGFDLGFPAGDRHHSSLSKHYEVRESETGSLGLYGREDTGNHQVPGNFGGSVLTTLVYKGAIWAAEQTIRSYPDLRCYNTSSGALVPGAEPTPVGEIRLARDGVDRGQLVDDLFRRYFTTRGHGPVRDDEASALRRRALEALTVFRGLVEGQVESRARGMEILGKLHTHLVEMTGDPERILAAALLGGSIRSFCVLLAQTLNRKAAEGASLEIFRAAADRFVAFLDAAEEKVSDGLFDVDLRSRGLAEILR